MRVVMDHEIPDRAPLVIAPGERVTVGERDTEWPAFVLVTAAAGEGWVPERHLDAARPVATVLSGYDTRELPVAAGDSVEPLRDDAVSGWCWCRDLGGREGWVPHRVLQMD
ncbi:SH3 domain-containing protein [Demequina lignilytica]|uniref:SH3 domain-containing protein n=1 Tax=Demequina lignilytica TaxID=3051663 RepID=A0AB35MHA2_9MICO|nr:SH3 domain-containing protein [Demequina sp. SYSU T0a273]MDN4483154.1 SH3 domain-containing protein [Demequina sp. SYSU T0a273]